MDLSESEIIEQRISELEIILIDKTNELKLILIIDTYNPDNLYIKTLEKEIKEIQIKLDSDKSFLNYLNQ